jgi:hypothetical protein
VTVVAALGAFLAGRYLPAHEVDQSDEEIAAARTDQVLAPVSS